jgi:integrase
VTLFFFIDFSGANTEYVEMKKIKKLKPYKLYRRGGKSSKPVYYVRFRYDDGSWSSGKSTGATNRWEAERIAINAILDMGGKLLKPAKKTFREIADNFFDLNGEWAAERRVTGKKVNRGLCYLRNLYITKYAYPVIADIDIDKITAEHLKEIRNTAYKTKSQVTTNKIYSAIIEILEHCKNKGLINEYPEIKKVAPKKKKKKGILTLAEAERVLQPENWSDDRILIMCLLASCTGMRLGEIAGLRHKDVIREKNCGIINISQSWNNHYKQLNESTKTGRGRVIVIPLSVLSELEFLKSSNPHGQDENVFIFYNSKFKNRPLDVGRVSERFYEAMERAGISKEEREKRNITFHSWRYYFNTFLINSKIPIQKVQSVTGHVTNEMSEHYYIGLVEEMADVLALQEKITESLKTKI